MTAAFPRVRQKTDVCVVGGGMAGLCAAVAAARRGSRVCLVHERPVLGGNASSEVRMWICGATGPNNKETGILEELQLNNLARNPGGCYSIWDSVLYEAAAFTPGLTLILNATCVGGSMRDGRLRSIRAWQMTTQSWIEIESAFFIDCSGDSVLGPITGAAMRAGRESREEFGESIAPAKSDLKTMGNSILLQIEETGEKQEFSPPSWAHRFDEESTLPSRIGQGFGANFWWIELGGLQDTIGDAESIRHELYRTAWGVWDYLKNRGPQTERLANWRLRWLGSLPGKRENRRYRAPYTLTQNDIESGGHFEDVVAYGGWSMDDHHPAGLLYPGKATLFHPAPSPYGIPFRCLHSADVPNLLFAGRNISATHVALSSTRVMGTCALLGQAVGTAAALCRAERCDPADLFPLRIPELQRQLQEDDCWLPGIVRNVTRLTRDANLVGPPDVEHLRDGHDRDLPEDPHGVEVPPGSPITFLWKSQVPVAGIRLVLDSNLSNPKRMPCSFALGDAPLALPQSLLKDFAVEISTSRDSWETAWTDPNNHQRLVYVPIKREVRALRIVPRAGWGTKGCSKIFSVDIYDNALPPRRTDPPDGSNWKDLVAAVPANDLAPPDNGLEENARGSGRFGA